MDSFQFKQFSIRQDQCSMKIGTDGVLLGAWVPVEESRRVLDIGTGTGVIAIMIAQRTSETVVHGIEIEQTSYSQAHENMANSEWSSRLGVFHGAIQDYANQTDIKYDLIVSNPPFFTGGTLSVNQNKTNVRHTTKLSHSDLLVSVQKLLTPDGRFALILPLIEGLRCVEMAEQYNLYCTKMTQVKSQVGKPVERLLLVFEKDKKEIQKDELVIQSGGGRHEYTDPYITLTRDFYLNL